MLSRLGIPVKAGPSEATAIGNLLVQALVLGKLRNLTELRKLVLNSFDIKAYEPQDVDEWNQAYESFVKYKNKPIYSVTSVTIS